MAVAQSGWFKSYPIPVCHSVLGQILNPYCSQWQIFHNQWSQLSAVKKRKVLCLNQMVTPRGQVPLTTVSFVHQTGYLYTASLDLVVMSSFCVSVYNCECSQLFTQGVLLVLALAVGRWPSFWRSVSTWTYLSGLVVKQLSFHSAHYHGIIQHSQEHTPAKPVSGISVFTVVWDSSQTGLELCSFLTCRKWKRVERELKEGLEGRQRKREHIW